jgi:hypothetical protein
MITAREYVIYKPKTFFIHAVELLRHVLKGDHRQTAYVGKGKNFKSTHHLRDLMEYMEEHKKESNADFKRLQKESYRRKKAWRDIDAETGDIQIDRYLNNERKMYTDQQSTIKKKRALSLIFDIGTNANERGDSFVNKRYEKIYKLTFQAMADRRPCRVIAVDGHGITEIRGRPLAMYMVIKDYRDPIFPGIWGALKGNAQANTLLNCIAEYFIGTEDYGNGHSTTVYINSDIRHDEIQLIDCKRVKLKGTYKGGGY